MDSDEESDEDEESSGDEESVDAVELDTPELLVEGMPDSSYFPMIVNALWLCRSTI